MNRIEIEEFRGIRDLKLDLDSQNFAVCGPNGTGKSGIVDAIEFGLTGSISRLTGKGRGALSVKAHGPHVNSRHNPEKAVVTLHVTIPHLARKATIRRTVKSPKAPVIAPDDPVVRAVFDQVEQHPEFTLSRREIIKYVLAEPGERAKELQALLQLDALETARATLLKIKNAADREVKLFEPQKAFAAESLRRALGVAEVKTSLILPAVNAKRAVLDLPELAKLEASTSIRDGLDSQVPGAPAKLAKVQATEDLAAAVAALTDHRSDQHRQRLITAREAVLKLKQNEAKLDGLTRDSMLATALELFDEQACPVCQTEWDPKEFRAIVEAQRKELVQIASERKAAEALLTPIIETWRNAHAAIAPIISFAGKLPSAVEVTPAKAYRDDLKARLDAVVSFLPLDATLGAVDDDLENLAAVQVVVETLSIAVAELPEPSERDAARDYLTVGQERLETWRTAAVRLEAAKHRAAVATRVHEIYSETTDRALEAVYKEVEAEFRKLYRLINGDDESKFEAQLTPSFGKLGFEVDFYGKGFFPPGAYHSEGHQDGMGLCLYLALMKHLLGAGFTLAVLDDVVMSVDTGHRREVCKLLKGEFPETQFVLTTHDDVWLKHMRSAKFVDGKRSIVFRKWHVDHGPAEWKTEDVWAEIDEFVAQNDIRAAAGLLRYYLEYQAAEWCARLAGQVEYRGDGRYELNDLLQAAIHALGKLYKRAKAANQSWGGPATRLIEIEGLEDAFSEAVAKASVEQWQINPSVHYNEWANLKREDFSPVVEAFKRLERGFECEKCADPLYIAYTGKEKDALRCACAHINLNVKKEPKQQAA